LVVWKIQLIKVVARVMNWRFTKIKEVCDANNLKISLRWCPNLECFGSKSKIPKAFGKLFDTISVCLSKGWSANWFCFISWRLHSQSVTHSKNIRWRDASVRYWLQPVYFGYVLERLSEDHETKEIAEVLKKLGSICRTCRNKYSIF
jgi:threonine aldolase